MKTEKKCKGSGKAAGYGCETLQPVALGNQANHKYGLAKTCGCFQAWLINSKEGQELISRSTLKAKKTVQKKIKSERRKEKDSIRNWKKEIQTKVQHIARLIDKDLPCLTLTEEKIKKLRRTPQMHGGHIYTKGGNTQMRFNLHNIHRQSGHSNHKQSDDYLMIEGLIREYGESYFEFIKGLKKFPVPKLSDQEYKEAYYRALKIVNALIKENSTYDVEDRILMRNRFNFEIGIYSWDQTQYRL